MSAPDAKPGDALPARTVGPVTRMEFARFSISTDDPNRVHIEEAVAAAAGFPHVIGSGGIVSGVLTEVVADWAGIERLRAGKIRMFTPLVPDVTLTASGSVTDRADDGTLTVVVEVRDGDGTKVGGGTYTVVP